MGLDVDAQKKIGIPVGLGGLVVAFVVLFVARKYRKRLAQYRARLLNDSQDSSEDSDSGILNKVFRLRQTSQSSLSNHGDPNRRASFNFSNERRVDSTSFINLPPLGEDPFHSEEQEPVLRGMRAPARGNLSVFPDYSTEDLTIETDLVVHQGRDHFPHQNHDALSHRVANHSINPLLLLETDYRSAATAAAGRVNVEADYSVTAYSGAGINADADSIEPDYSDADNLSDRPDYSDDETLEYRGLGAELCPTPAGVGHSFAPRHRGVDNLGDHPDYSDDEMLDVDNLADDPDYSDDEVLDDLPAVLKNMPVKPFNYLMPPKS